MKPTFLIFISVINIFFVNSQLNVHECNDFNSTITQQELISNTIIEKPCVFFDANTPYNFISNFEKIIKAQNSIQITGTFHAKPLQNGSLDLEIKPKTSFDVFLMNYSDLISIKKLNKLEFGITLPNDILEKVTNFITNANVQDIDKINPYLDWEIRTYIEITTPTQNLWGNFTLPSEVIQIDGFFNKEYEEWMQNPLSIYDGTQPLELYWEGNTYNGFYNQLGGYDEIPSEEAFLFRYSPPRIGTYDAKVYIQTPTITYISDGFQFNVIDSDNKGYVSVGNESRYLTLANKSFYPLGANILWPGTQDDVKNNTGYSDPYLENLLTKTYPTTGETYVLAEEWRQVKPIPRIFDNHRQLIKNIADGGGNFARLIMHPASQDIEYEKLGDYTDRLYIAQEMDKTLEYCESRGIYLDWNLQIQYPLLRDVGSPFTWDKNYLGFEYCYKNIAGVNKPMDFFSNEKVKKYYKQRIRYVLARWGYSTNIAMFELFSEINTKQFKDKVFIPFFNIYDYPDFNETEAQIIEAWHEEMANYIKSIYNGKTHLIAPSYIPGKLKADETFRKQNIDLITTNHYTGLKTYAKNWINEINGLYLNQETPTYNDGSYMIDCEELDINFGSGYKCNYFKKPMYLPEYNAIEEICDDNQIEVKRTMWQLAFSGLAGAFSWYSYKNGIVFQEYAKIKQFMANLDDLDGGGWHPGAMELKEDGRWEYKENWGEDMDKYGKKADLMYLRSADKNFAIGVITNKTYNIKSVDGCSGDLPSDFMEYDDSDEVTDVNINTQGLKLHGMNSGRYYINYFFPSDLSNPFTTVENNGPPTINLANVTIPATETGYIVLFMARKRNTSWFTKDTNSTTKNLIEEKTIEEKTNHNAKLEIDKINIPEIKVYPSPTFNTITIENNLNIDNLKLIISSMDDKILKSIDLKNEKERINLFDLQKGIYFLRFYNNNELIDQKKVIKI
jgi:hypothetical protein